MHIINYTSFLPTIQWIIIKCQLINTNMIPRCGGNVFINYAKCLDTMVDIYKGFTL